jgi:hypothetical protein
VCAKRRPDHSCAQAAAFAQAAAARGVHASVSVQNLTHAQVNATLGLPGAETDAVDAFLAGLGLRD